MFDRFTILRVHPGQEKHAQAKSRLKRSAALHVHAKLECSVASRQLPPVDQLMRIEAPVMGRIWPATRAIRRGAGRQNLERQERGVHNGLRFGAPWSGFERSLVST